MNEQQNKKNGLNTLFQKVSKRWNRINIMEKESVARLLNETEADKTAELIRNAQANINHEIRFRVHQPIGNFTKFEQNNLIISLTEEEEKHSNEIFAPFIAKGYTIIPLAEYEPFTGYDVYLLSWK